MGKLMDLTGRHFGRLVVIGRADNGTGGETRWVCQCNCRENVTVEVFGKNLRRGHTTSCGCYARESGSTRNTMDLVGSRFGRLVVESRAENIGEHTRWNCLCDCGNRKAIYASTLGRFTFSCGCFRDDKVRDRRAVEAQSQVGKKFGLLQLTDRYAPEEKNGRSTWRATCACGGTWSGQLKDLLRRQKSGLICNCGCLGTSRLQASGTTRRPQLWSSGRKIVVIEALRRLRDGRKLAREAMEALRQLGFIDEAGEFTAAALSKLEKNDRRRTPAPPPVVVDPNPNPTS